MKQEALELPKIIDGKIICPYCGHSTNNEAFHGTVFISPVKCTNCGKIVIDNCNIT